MVEGRVGNTPAGAMSGRSNVASWSNKETRRRIASTNRNSRSQQLRRHAQCTGRNAFGMMFQGNLTSGGHWADLLGSQPVLENLNP